MTVPNLSNQSDSQRLRSRAVSCPICADSRYFDFLTIESMPVSDGLVRRTKEEALSTPLGAITLACCESCGYIGNRRFDPSKLVFSPEYMISLHHSPRYRKFLEDQCDYLIDAYQLKNRTVLEIGCGQGYFLELLCRRGDLSGYGFDPAVKEYGTVQLTNSQVTLSPEDYAPRCDAIRPNLICCRHVMQLITDPHEFMRTLRSQLKWEPPAVVYFEIPNASSIFRPDVVWCIMYEYRSYWSESSLTTLFQQTGFEVRRTAPCFVDGQYVQIEAVPSSSRRTNPVSRPEQLVEQARSFGKAYQQQVEHWGNRLADMASSHRRIAAWGSGGRAICFFNALQLREQIPYVVDINPDRQECYLPWTAQKIVAPEFLKDFRPDVIIVTNPTYENEIRSQVAGMGLKAEVLSL